MSVVNVAVLTLAGLCLGIALTGFFAALLQPRNPHERLSLALVYVAFMGLIALPVVRTFAAAVLINYMPLLLILLLALPPAFYHYVTARTVGPSAQHVPWRDLVLPSLGGMVCVGYWILPAEAKSTMFVSGDLPPGFWPATLALVTFVLILTWFFASFAYLVAILGRLKGYRAHIRQLYSDAESRDLRWVDVMMFLFILIWTVGAVSLADENFARGTLFLDELFLILIAGGLLILNICVPLSPPRRDIEVEEDTPDSKYARSALKREHAEKLAVRIERAMRKDTLYLDPGLSLQKLSQHVGALPNHVSQTLNQEIGASFFDYVAHWRIEASKPQIAAGDESVTAVALEVGFNSRSAFYKAFKRETGVTPKGYRALQHGAV